MLKIFFLSSLFILMGCSELLFHRSHLAEMEHNDSRFFHPNEDFPILSGDTGTMSASDEEMSARVPASEEEILDKRNREVLESELSDLISKESDLGKELYQEHKKKFLSVSERIYFLKLPASERRDYLISRGFIQRPQDHPYTPHERLSALQNSEIVLGMSKEDVRESWGKPTRVEIAGNARNENERWVYHANGATKYIYFESGRVGGWE